MQSDTEEVEEQPFDQAQEQLSPPSSGGKRQSVEPTLEKKETSDHKSDRFYQNFDKFPVIQTPESSTIRKQIQSPPT